MGLFIQTNVGSLIAAGNLQNTQGNLALNFQKLSSGFRINSAADDAAGLGISKRLSAQQGGYTVAMRNASDAISMASTADGAANEIHSLLDRMRQLAVQSANGTNSTNDSANLDTEFQSALSEIGRIINVTTYNGASLLNNSTATTFQVGINNSSNDQLTLTFGGASLASLGISNATTNINGQSNAQAAITTIDTAITSLSGIRENFGSIVNRLQSTVNNLQSVSTNLAAAISRIRDTDIASETSALSRNQVLSQAGAAVLAQANQTPQIALTLLRG